MNPIGLKTWTDEQDRMLRALHAQGLSYDQVGARLGVSRNAAIGRGHRLGLSKPRIPGTSRSGPRNRSPNRPKAEPRLSKRRMAMMCKDKQPASADIQMPRAKRLVDLEHNECRWPFGDSNFVFCAMPTHEGQTYCCGHQRIAYGRVVGERAQARMSRFGNWAAKAAE